VVGSCEPSAILLVPASAVGLAGEMHYLQRRFCLTMQVLY
jgi:hypothetical protein